jgi:hypothetical protein
MRRTGPLEFLTRFVGAGSIDIDHSTRELGIGRVRRGGQAVRVNATVLTSGDGEFAGKHRSSSAFEIA